MSKASKHLLLATELDESAEGSQSHKLENFGHEWRHAICLLEFGTELFPLADSAADHGSAKDAKPLEACEEGHPVEVGDGVFSGAFGQSSGLVMMVIVLHQVALSLQKDRLVGLS